jgi:hypothetical protein
MHRKLSLLVAGVVGAAALAGPAGALADGGGNIPFIQYQNAFGGNVENLAVGTPLQLNYLDPSGQTSVVQYCWSPAPLDRPACSSSSTGAPAQTGTQTIVAQLTNGQSVSTTFAVGAAPTSMGGQDPVPYTVNEQITLSGDANLDTAIGQLDAGQPVAAVAIANSRVTEVYDYATGQTGYVPTSALSNPGQTAETFTRTIRLLSRPAATYHLILPAAFEATSAQTVTYEIYPTSSPRLAVARTVGSGRQRRYLGVTVLRSSRNANVLSITVKTGRLSRLVALELSANGTA